MSRLGQKWPGSSSEVAITLPPSQIDQFCPPAPFIFLWFLYLRFALSFLRTLVAKMAMTSALQAKESSRKMLLMLTPII